MYRNLTKKQTEILLYIKKETNNKGYPPTVREICDGVNLRSPSSVHAHLTTLELKGFIRKDPTKPRAIEVVEYENEYFMAKKKTVDVPILGQVTAGIPILAVENVEDTYPIPMDEVNDDDVFMLKVKGESMIDAGIMDGDLVLVKEQATAINGDIVVALLGDEATVKRFFKEKDRIRLQPENQFMEPIYSRDVVILGKVKRLYRSY